MGFRRDHFFEALSLAALAFSLAFVTACTHDPVLTEKIKREAQEQPTQNAQGRLAETKETIQNAPISDAQKAKLDEITRSASADLSRLREEESKLRMLLIKQLVNPKATDREIDAIKSRILETNKKSNKRWLSALNEAQGALGRRDEVDAHYYRAIIAEPLPKTKDSVMIEQP